MDARHPRAVVAGAMFAQLDPTSSGKGKSSKSRKKSASKGFGGGQGECKSGAEDEGLDSLDVNLIEAPRLLELPLDFARSGTCRVETVEDEAPVDGPDVDPSALSFGTLLAAFASTLSVHARQETVVLGVDGLAVAVVCARNETLQERLNSTREALAIARGSLFDSVEEIVKAPAGAGRSPWKLRAQTRGDVCVSTPVAPHST